MGSLIFPLAFGARDSFFVIFHAPCRIFYLGRATLGFSHFSASLFYLLFYFIPLTDIDVYYFGFVCSDLPGTSSGILLHASLPVLFTLSLPLSFLVLRASREMPPDMAFLSFASCHRGI